MAGLLKANFSTSGYFLRPLIWRKHSNTNLRSNRHSCDQNGLSLIEKLMCTDKSNKLVIDEIATEEIQVKGVDSLKLPKGWMKQKAFLSTLDIFISLFIVTPLVVACWRGTWQLMDIYAYYFPPWESFVVGTIIHIFIGITQESFHEVLNRKHKNGIINFSAIFLMKLYTVVLNIVTNLHWRGAWIIIDEYFGIVMTETGETKVARPFEAFLFFGFCFTVMFFMKCLRNLNSPPFEICMDYGDDMFLFPNMFKVNITIIIALNTKNRISSGSNQDIKSDSLYLMNTYGSDNNFKQNIIKKRKIDQNKPENQKSFAIPVEISDSNPKNIQEILDSAPKKAEDRQSIYNNPDYNKYKLHGIGFQKDDLFSSFKPSAPGDINNLVAGFRFAPSNWQVVSQTPQKPSKFVRTADLVRQHNMEQPIYYVVMNIFTVGNSKDHYRNIENIVENMKISKRGQLTMDLKFL
ncbi:uncharacterized protein LOC115875359 isoform X2 [Sitophilus oryzae]|uniref:Uncharacterized protein LOC115875359 isoform X2 n=1 Tax=Sitophilus oryzae TaxID=7048 RepID=A0A6J2X636_SITOR|nr:uncharacterized protein LOC115875359 isoform X2 [Sitophilus oryzae]